MAIYNAKNYSKLHRIIHCFSCVFLLVPFYTILFRLKVVGKENIPKDKKPFIVMANHLSNFDPPLLSGALQIPIAYMAKQELFKIPILREIISFYGAFSVDRKKVEKTTLKAALEILKKDWCVGLFLEGTRNKTPGKLGKPNSGPPFVANIGKVPILPVGILGSEKPFGPITVKIGKLFYPDKDIEKGKLECAKKLCELTEFEMPDA